MRMSRMTRKLVCVLILASMTLLGAGAYAAPKRRFVIATAGTAGALYPMGVAMAETINKHSDRFVASAESSAASVANIRNMDEGKVEWGISQSEIASFAYSGTEIFKGKKVDGLQALFATVGSSVQIFVPADSPVKSIADLKGKRVGVGSPGSGGEVDARMVLAYYAALTAALYSGPRNLDTAARRNKIDYGHEKELLTVIQSRSRDRASQGG